MFKTFIIGYLIVAIVVYLLISFVALSFNCFSWSKDLRICFASFGQLLSLFGGAIVYNANESSKDLD